MEVKNSNSSLPGILAHGTVALEEFVVRTRVILCMIILSPSLVCGEGKEYKHSEPWPGGRSSIQSIIRGNGIIEARFYSW